MKDRDIASMWPVEIKSMQLKDFKYASAGLSNIVKMKHPYVKTSRQHTDGLLAVTLCNGQSHAFFKMNLHKVAGWDPAEISEFELGESHWGCVNFLWHSTRDALLNKILKEFQVQVWGEDISAQIGGYFQTVTMLKFLPD